MARKKQTELTKKKERQPILDSARGTILLAFRVQHCKRVWFQETTGYLGP